MTLNSTEKSIEDTVYFKLVHYVNLIGLVIASAGIMLNFCSYHTARHLKYKNSSVTLIRCLAVWDSIAIFQDGVVNLGGNFFNYNAVDFNRFNCKVFYYHSWGSTFTAIYHMNALAVDRCFAIAAPVWYKQNSTPRLAYKTSITVTLAIYTLVVGNLYIFDIVDGVCTFNAPADVVYWYVRLLLGIFMVVIPLIIMVIANIFFIYKLRSRSSKDNSERRVTIMLITSSFAFMILMTQCDIFLIIMFTLNPVTVEERAFALFLEKTAEIFAIANSSMNFIFYFVSGPMFRTAFFSLIDSIFL